MQQEHVKPHSLYVSDRCEWSKKIQKDLMEAGLMDTFTVVSIESAKVPFPPQITSVPTILADNKQILTGKEAFAWIEREKTKAVSTFDFAEASGIGFSMVEDDSFATHHQQNFTYI
jgi:predicted thioredoxin/glutaredoxin